ncbi:MAG: alpha/beta hydrolase family protein [Gemmataceae bacterium]
MPDVSPDSKRYDGFIIAQGQALRAKDEAPLNRPEWQRRRAALRDAMMAAMGPVPATACDLDPKILGILDRKDYRIEKLVFQSRPDVWVTGNVYAPKLKGRYPAVLCVHGHWAGARRDPVVQARCLGLVKLGFVVLAVDAFGSGERYAEPAAGTYHGALYGASLWPTGYTLLGMQVYDNRRAVDYLLTRDDVDGTKLGITGASGGGNQTMYAGALDERIKAVVPVCSVGTYQAYLKAACCVCEVLPGALRFTEEGDVLGLVAPRALLVINASQDAFQFSPGEAVKSFRRATAIYQLNTAGDKIKHVVFESKHDYSKPMREAMYGWMTKFLKGTTDGAPIDEPTIAVETPADLACFPDPAERPANFLFPRTFADRAGAELIAKANRLAPRHPEDWESSATQMRSDLQRIFGGFPKAPRVVAKPGPPRVEDGIESAGVRLAGEAEVPIPMFTVSVTNPPAKQPACVLLHLGGKLAAVQHPIARALAKRGWYVVAPDVRATGDTKPEKDAVHNAPDHNSSEHAVWIGRPLPGQWVHDVATVLEWLALQPGLDPRRTAVVGIGQAGVVALLSGALMPDRVTSVGTVGGLTSLVTTKPYGDGTRMALFAPGLLTVGDLPHLAAMCAPRRLLMSDAILFDGNRIGENEMRAAFAFTSTVYKTFGATDRLGIVTDVRPDDIARRL